MSADCPKCGGKTSTRDERNVHLCRCDELASDRLDRRTPAGTDSPSYVSSMRDAGRMR